MSSLKFVTNFNTGFTLKNDFNDPINSQSPLFNCFSHIYDQNHFLTIYFFIFLKIYHPNIDLSGKICLNILREDWKPVLNLNSIMIGLQFLFLEPNPDDPLNKGIFFLDFYFLFVNFSIL